MLATLGTRGDTQLTSILSEPTRSKPSSVGAGTAIEKKEQREITNSSSDYTILHTFDL